MKLSRKQTIAPKESAHFTIKTKLPGGVSGPITVEAKLVYESAPQMQFVRSWGRTPSD